MHVHRFEKRQSVSLDSIATTHPEDVAKREARKRFVELDEELFALQDLMWGARTHSVMVVLQGRDAAGKDGAVKHVMGGLNPRGVHVTSFGVPTEEELQHDFLWRVHRHAPRAGEMAIFNRSHYEDVLVVRVKKLVEKRVWKGRYDLINAFEETLAQANTIVLKYFLHISRDEQEQRLLAREKDPSNAWKLNVEDWKERKRWDEFTTAYEDAIGRCASPRAPWFVVPADAKWYRDLVIAETLADALRPHREEWEQTLAGRGKLLRHDLKQYRKSLEEKGEEP